MWGVLVLSYWLQLVRYCIFVLFFLAAIFVCENLEIEPEPEEFIADHPFAFIIYTNSSSLPVFVGRFSDPINVPTDDRPEELWRQCYILFYLTQ